MRSSDRVVIRFALLLGVGSASVPASALAEVDVVATIKPVHSLVAGVMQGVGEPVLLVKGGGSGTATVCVRRQPRSRAGRGGVLGRRDRWRLS